MAAELATWLGLFLGVPAALGLLSAAGGVIGRRWGNREEVGKGDDDGRKAPAASR